MATELLKGEGETKLLLRKRVRHECNCGEVATQRHSYLLPRARSNPNSRGYGKDDVSWRSDHEEFTCDACPLPNVEGFEWCATFGVANFPHMLLTWIERDAANILTGARDVEAALTGVQSILAEWIVPDSGISDHEALSRILGITDHRDVLAKQQVARQSLAA
jgi:hypothetical protein